MIEYKKLHQDNYPIFHELMTAYYRDGEDADTEQAVLDAFILDLFSLVMENKIEGCFVHLNGEVIGFALWMIDTPDGVFSEVPGYGTFLEIGIHPSFRGKRYGYQAVAYIEQQMKQLGVENFYVSVYPLADGFWTKCGYIKTEETASNGLRIYKK